MNHIIFFLSKPFSSEIRRLPPEVQVPSHVAHKDIHFTTISLKRDSTAKDNNYV